MVSGRRTDLIGGGFALLVGLLYLLRAVRLPFWTLGGNPGGGFMPVCLGVAMILLSLLLLGRTFQRWLPPHTAVMASPQHRLWKPGYVLGAVIGYVIVFPTLGYVITSALLIGALLWIFDSAPASFRKAVRVGVVSLAVVALFFAVFVVLLELQLPPWPFGG